MQPYDRINLDISFMNFEYAINACLERCQTKDDCKRLASEILRVMKIRAAKEQKNRNKTLAIDYARQYRHVL